MTPAERSPRVYEPDADTAAASDDDAVERLTARVAANHVWQHRCGVGLVPTPDNFGLNGTKLNRRDGEIPSEGMITGAVQVPSSARVGWTWR